MYAGRRRAGPAIEDPPGTGSAADGGAGSGTSARRPKKQMPVIHLSPITQIPMTD